MNIGDADFYEAMTEGLHVGSWCPTPTPTVPPTQVHLTIPSSFGKVLLRFKSTHSLDQLIAALIRHRAPPDALLKVRAALAPKRRKP